LQLTFGAVHLQSGVTLFLKLHRRFLIDNLQIFIRKKGIKSYKTAEADFE